MNILRWLKGGSWSKPAPVLKMQNTLPPPVLKFDPKNIRQLDLYVIDSVLDYRKLSADDRTAIARDSLIVGCAFVGDQNGKVVRVDPMKIMMRSNGSKKIYTYESSK